MLIGSEVLRFLVILSRLISLLRGGIDDDIFHLFERYPSEAQKMDAGSQLLNGLVWISHDVRRISIWEDHPTCVLISTT